MVLHLQLFDWVIGSHKGALGTPRGRATAHGKLLESGVKSQSTHTVIWILTGAGSLEQAETNRLSELVWKPRACEWFCEYNLAQTA